MSLACSDLLNGLVYTWYNVSHMEIADVQQVLGKVFKKSYGDIILMVVDCKDSKRFKNLATQGLLEVITVSSF